MFTTYKNVESRTATIATGDEALKKNAEKLAAAWGMNDTEARAYFLRLGVNRAMTLLRDRARRVAIKKGKTPKVYPRLVPAKTPDEVSAMLGKLCEEWAGSIDEEDGEAMTETEAKAYCVRMGINRSMTLARFPKAEAKPKKASKKTGKKAAKKKATSAVASA